MRKTGKKQRICIAVAVHKPFAMPSDPMYLPLHVGAEGKTDESGKPLDLGFVKDNEGDNISSLNDGFCELTGLYYMWKHCDAEYIGLVHYRRHFGHLCPTRRLLLSKKRRGGGGMAAVLGRREIEPLLSRRRVFVPKKRWYVIETLYSHYAHTHYAEHLDAAAGEIRRQCPEYLPSFKRVMRQRGGYMFNMMILRRDDMDAYCSWLFPLLFSLKDRFDREKRTAGLDAYQGRLYGRVSELLFNVWLDHQIREGRIRKKEIMELPLVNIGKTDYVRKVRAFLGARFFKRRYEKSF